MNLKTIKNKMEELSWIPKKHFGQHFLINEHIIKKIILSIKKLNPDHIVEVGPGLGALTHSLISLQIPITLIEKDPSLCEYWKNKNINSIKNTLEGNALRIPWDQDLPGNSALVGNLPYQIASRLMIQCCPGPLEVKNMILMFQKEVAERIISKPFSKTYGILSVLSQCYWNIKPLIRASIYDFYPRPKVAGQVLLFQRKPIPHIDHSSFLNFVKLCFEQRRKFLFNKLKKREGIIIADVYENMNLPHSLRAEELSPYQFLSFFQQLKNRKQNKYEKQK